MNVLVTGGLGFIGSHFVDLVLARGHRPVVLDALTYAGNRANLAHVPGVQVEIGDICDADLVRRLLEREAIDAVFNFAAETHVDRSIEGPAEFVRTNVVGTSVLLAEALRVWTARGRPADFRFVQISTDEVFGALAEGGPDKFTEDTPYAPNSPYSASKAGGDHLVRAYGHTYGLPTLITHCSNNYGPRQYPEKLIPALLARALHGQTMGVYGDGRHVRDWLHVSDHARGIWAAFERGRPGEHYCFGGNHELENLALVTHMCDVLAELRPGSDPHRLITFVPDRPGHDRRYAIDFTKARRELGYAPSVPFADGFRATIAWYLDGREES